jgi:hypothetical protein
VKHLVFSGGEQVLDVPFLNIKYRIEKYFRDTVCASKAVRRCTFLHTAYFYENLVSKKGTKRISTDGRAGTVRFATPLRADEKIPMIFSSDIGTKLKTMMLVCSHSFVPGKIAADALLHPGRLSKARSLSVPVAGDLISPNEYVRIFSQVANTTAVYEQQSIVDFAAQPIPGKGVRQTC